MKNGVRCPNMNHSRLNVPVKFCPTCGESLNRAAVGHCDTQKHAELRKDRNIFCHDCGKKIGLPALTR
jgi:DNA-directed RNA polymerase subunit RPC12/RpoP